MEVDLGPGHIVLDGVQLCVKRAQQPLHLYGPCLLWLRSPMSATAELLYKRSPKNQFFQLSQPMDMDFVVIASNVQYQDAVSMSESSRSANE